MAQEKRTHQRPLGNEQAIMSTHTFVRDQELIVKFIYTYIGTFSEVCLICVYKDPRKDLCKGDTEFNSRVVYNDIMFTRDINMFDGKY